MDGRDEGRIRIFGPAPTRLTLEIKSSRFISSNRLAFVYVYEVSTRSVTDTYVIRSPSLLPTDSFEIKQAQATVGENIYG